MMKLKKFSSLTLKLLMIFVFASILSTGCTKYAGPGELSAMDQQKAAAESAEQALVDCENESAALARQISDKEKELADAKAEKEKVQQRLSQM